MSGILENKPAAMRRPILGAERYWDAVVVFRKARLGDALIAQTCVDRKIPLLTRDQDFRAFADAAQLNLVL